MTDLLDTVQSELSEKMVPWPDDYVEDLSPPATLFLLRQMAMAALKVATGAVLSLKEDGDEENPTLTEVMNGVAAAVAGATHACVALGVLPIEAEDAMASGESSAPPEVTEGPQGKGPVYS